MKSNLNFLWHICFWEYSRHFVWVLCKSPKKSLRYCRKCDFEVCQIIRQVRVDALLWLFQAKKDHVSYAIWHEIIGKWSWNANQVQLTPYYGHYITLSKQQSCITGQIRHVNIEPSHRPENHSKPRSNHSPFNSIDWKRHLLTEKVNILITTGFILTPFGPWSSQ